MKPPAQAKLPSHEVTERPDRSQAGPGADQRLAHQQRDRPHQVGEHDGDDERASTSDAHISREAPDVSGAHRHPDRGHDEGEATREDLALRA
jgi:hypothetical protein